MWALMDNFSWGNPTRPSTFGELVAVLSPDGRLLQLDDRFIPTVELPTRPQVEREVARKKVVGRTFTYTDIAGRPQQMSISVIRVAQTFSVAWLVRS